MNLCVQHAEYLKNTTNASTNLAPYLLRHLASYLLRSIHIFTYALCLPLKGCSFQDSTQLNLH